jgi:hypothetical protein
MSSNKKNVAPPAVYLPADWEISDVSAVQACIAGTATPEQQRRAIKWIVYRAAGTDDVEYRPNDRDHAFASGRRFVGLQIRKLSAINTAALRHAQGADNGVESRSS